MGRIRSVAATLTRDRARDLRRNQTVVEARLWEALRAGRLDGWKWRRQTPVGPFIVDFVCLEAALAVELDGGVHAGQVEYDVRRQAFIAARGLKVLRFWNREIENDFGGVCWTILKACRESDPVQRGRRIDRRH